MTDREYHDILEAYRHGQDGGSFEVINSADSSPVEIAHLKTAMPHPWLITLCAAQPRGGIIGGDPGSVDRKLIEQLQMKAVIQWGSDKATEIAEVDWPVQGCTVAVTGKTVRVFGQHPPLVLTPGGIRPVFSGFVAPNSHGRGNVRFPTWTSPTQVVSFVLGSFQDFEVPKRAVMYRIVGWWEDSGTGERMPLWVPPAADPVQWVVKQLIAPAADIESDFAFQGAPPMVASETQLGEASSWVPLHPGTTRIRGVMATSPAGALSDMQVAVQFGLDLG